MRRLSDMEIAPDGTIYAASAEYPYRHGVQRGHGRTSATVPVTSLGYYYWSPTTTLAFNSGATRAYVVVAGLSAWVNTSR